MFATPKIPALVLAAIALVSATAGSAGHPSSAPTATSGVPLGAIAPRTAPAPLVTSSIENHNATGAPRWYNVTSSGSPTGRNRLAMAPDPTLGGLLMFGGYNPPGSTQFFNDTWLLHGGAWTQLFPYTSPGPRSTFAMAWDSSDSVDLIFGGHPPFGSASDLNDTWTFAGTGNGNWTMHPTPPGLTYREGNALCDDPTDHGVLLFGGDSGAAGAPGMNDTWLYSAGTWTELFPAHVPGARTDTKCAWDAAANEDVMYGGETADPPATDLGDTWAFKAGDWSLVTSSGPSARIPNSLDPTPGGSLLTFSGVCVSGPCGNDTWQFANGSWSRVPESVPPTDRGWAAIAYDAATNASYLFGGSMFPPYAGWTNETYELVAPTISASALVDTFDVGAPAVASVQTGPMIAGGYLTIGWGDGSSPSIVSTGGSFYSSSHHYATTGTYNATITWTDRAGHQLATYLGYTVVAAPSVTVSATPSEGNTTPLAVAISASATGGVAPYSFSWLAGDGSATQTSSSAQGTLSANHEYQANGTFEVHLTVTDADGKTASATTNVTVTNSSSPHTNPHPNPSHSNPNSTSGPAPLPWLVWGILAAVVAVAALAGVVVGRGGRNR